MVQGLVTYPGVVKAKAATYTQRRGVRPDACKIDLVPQATTVANFGTATFSYDGGSLTLPNCSIDTTRIVYSDSGFLASIVLWDRRELWNYVAPISGHYNEMDATNQRVAATEKNLRELVDLLMLALGEPTYIGTSISTTVYPEVDWHCEKPVVALQQLLEEWGYDVVLNFGSESVEVVPIGTGTTLPANTDEIMQASNTFDPPIKPQIIRTCFGPSEAQARFLLEAVAMDTDGTFDPIGTVSYKPAGGWESIDPYRMQEFLRTATATQAELALLTMYRVYRVKAFADGTLDLPDGSDTLDDIRQVLPLDYRLLEEETVGTRRTRGQARLYGRMRVRVDATAQPPTEANTDVDDLLDVDFQFDQDRGLLYFDRPIYKVVAGEIKPADLYLETTFRIRDNDTFQFNEYTYDQIYDLTGYGTYTIPLRTNHAKTTFTYSAGHVVSGSSNNQSDLQTLAGLVAIAIEGRFHAESGQVIWYNQPQFAIRLDGLISEVTHIVTDGENGQPGAYTIGVRNMEFDRNLMSGVERRLILENTNNLQTARQRAAIGSRREKGNA